MKYKKGANQAQTIVVFSNHARAPPPRIRPGVPFKKDIKTHSTGVAWKNEIGTTAVRIDTDKPSPREEYITKLFLGGWSDPPRTPEELALRGTKGLSLVSHPKKGKNFKKRMKDNYFFRMSKFKKFPKSSIPSLGYDTSYGFQETDFLGFSVSSKNNLPEDIVVGSVGRSMNARDGNDYVAIIAHRRFATCDGNRYKITPNGNNIVDEDYNLIPAKNADATAVPISQLLYQAIKVRIIQILLTLITHYILTNSLLEFVQARRSQA